MDLETELEKLAEAAVSDWPEISLSGQLNAQIRDLYRLQLKFPATWSQEECDEFVESKADHDTCLLTTTFDEVIDTVIDRYGRQYGTLPDHDYAARLIADKRRYAVYDLESCLAVHKGEIAEITAECSGRGDGSMTGCSQALRRPRTVSGRPRHRRRRRP